MLDQTSVFRCLSTIILTAYPRWRENVLYFMKKTLQTGDWDKRREREREPGEKATEFTESCPEFNHTADAVARKG